MKDRIRRLGIDLGTNSLGWALLEIDVEGEQKGLPNYVDVVDIGVRIFSDGREPKTGVSLAVERRTARGMRTVKERRKQRHHQLASILKANGLLPSHSIETAEPYSLRHKASRERLSEHELGRALYHLSKRRGFKSNRLTDPVDGDKKLSEYKEQMANLELTLKDKELTIGSYLFSKRVDPNAILRFKDENKERSTRAMYETEFNKIKEVQSPFYPTLPWDDLYHAIFFQNPLKEGERGICSCKNCSNLRTYNATPSFERFRVWQDLNNLEGKDNRLNSQLITQSHRRMLFDRLLSKKKTVSFEAIKNCLNEKSLYKDNLNVNNINLEQGKKDGLKGLGSQQALVKILGLDCYQSLTMSQVDDLVETIIQSQTDERIKEKMAQLNLDISLFKALNGYKPDSKKVASMCASCCQKAAELMEHSGRKADDVLYEMGTAATTTDYTGEVYDKLPAYADVLTSALGANKRIGNPTVHIALNQLRVVVNAITDQYGKADEVVIELSRELKISQKKKEEIKKENDKNYRVNTKALDELKNEGFATANKRDDIRKWNLWQEQKQLCVYCGGHDGVASYPNLEIEHVLPYSRTLNNSVKNMLLSCPKCNHIKGNKSPYEAFYHVKTGDQWAQMIDRVPKHKKLLFEKDALERYEKDKKFLDSQLTDNAYIARTALVYMKSYINSSDGKDHVWASSGGVTALLRQKWGWDVLLSSNHHKKNRTDHRHHALDALAIALTSRSLISRVARESNKLDINDRLTASNTVFPSAPIMQDVILNKLADILPSIKPDHGLNGKLSKETAYGLNKTLMIITKDEMNSTDVTNMIDLGEKDNFLGLWQEVFSNYCTTKKKWQGKNILFEGEKSLKEIDKSMHRLYASTFKTTKDHYFSNRQSIKIYRDEWVAKSSIASMDSDKKIASIIDISIRKKLQSYVATATGDELKKRLHLFTLETGIKSVRCVAPYQNGLIEMRRDGKPYKAYATEDYLCVEIWRIPTKDSKGKVFYNYQGQFISRVEAMKKADTAGNNHISFSEQPHPAAKFMMQLYKQDVIRCHPLITEGMSEAAKKPVYMRVTSLNKAAGRIAMVPLHSSSKDLTDWREQTNYCLGRLVHPYWKDKPEGFFRIFNSLYRDHAKVEKVIITPHGKIYKGKNFNK